jgi:hypothetical protein
MLTGTVIFTLVIDAHKELVHYESYCFNKRCRQRNGRPK